MQGAGVIDKGEEDEVRLNGSMIDVEKEGGDPDVRVVPE